jgi:hypothetical protein
MTNTHWFAERVRTLGTTLGQLPAHLPVFDRYQFGRNRLKDVIVRRATANAHHMPGLEEIRAGPTRGHHPGGHTRDREGRDRSRHRPREVAGHGIRHSRALPRRISTDASAVVGRVPPAKRAPTASMARPDSKPAGRGCLTSEDGDYLTVRRSTVIMARLGRPRHQRTV